MNKMIIPVILGAIFVSGCQMNSTTGGTLLGAGAGGLLGSQMGSGKGKLISTAVGTLGGAIIGNSVGGKLDRADEHNKTPHNTTPVIVGTQTTEGLVYSECLEYAPGPVRSACNRGVKKRLYEAQRLAEDNAFNKGYKTK